MTLAYSLGRIAGMPVSFATICLGPASWGRGGRLRNAAKAALFPLPADLFAAIGLWTPTETRFFQGAVLGHTLPPEIRTNPFQLPLPPCIAARAGTACHEGPVFLPLDAAIGVAVLSVAVLIAVLYKLGPGVLRGVRRHLTALALFALFAVFVRCGAMTIHPASLSAFYADATATLLLAICLRAVYRAWLRVDNDLR